jgi:hypothetical protein
VKLDTNMTLTTFTKVPRQPYQTYNQTTPSLIFPSKKQNHLKNKTRHPQDVQLHPLPLRQLGMYTILPLSNP